MEQEYNPMLGTHIEQVDPDTLEQFDQLLEDPDGYNKVQQVLHNARLMNNVITVSEFDRYIPLFKWDGKDQMSPEEYKALSVEYANRICRFDPVYIVDDNNNVVMTLPPVFNRTNPINVTGEAGQNVAQAFVNACNLPDEIGSGKQEKYASLYMQVFSAAQNTAEHEHHQKVAAEMAEEALKVSHGKTLPNNQQQPKKEVAEIEEIESLDLKDSKKTTSSVPSNTNEVLPYSGDDEIEYM